MVNRSAYSDIYLNGAIKTAFYGFTERSSFPNSLIISGKRGSGKKTFARLAAMSIACTGEEKPCLKCEACRKIKEGLSPDVITVSLPKDRKTIGIDAVRSIRQTAYIAPNELDNKFYIIEDADAMTDQAQNALLKLFEEPPQRVYFFLLCSSASGLLSTVRSRAPELRTELFGRELIKELLLKKSSAAEKLLKTDPRGFERLVHMSGGSFGEALRLAESIDKKTFSGFSSAEKAVNALVGSSRSDFLSAVLSETGSRDAAIRLFELMSLALRDMVAGKKLDGGFETVFYSEAEEARTASGSFSLKSLLDLSYVLTEAQLRLSEINVSVQTAALYYADRLWELA